MEQKELADMGGMIRTLRKQQGYTVHELAYMTMLDPAELEAIEEGYLRPGGSSLILLGNALRVDHKELLNGRAVPVYTDSELMRICGEIRSLLGKIERDHEFMRNLKPETYESQTVLAADAVIRVYENSIGREPAESMIRRLTPEGRVTYAAMCQEYLRFGREVDRCLHMGLNPRNALYIGDTPQVLVDHAGCAPLPMYITQSHFRKSIREKSERNSHYHGLTVEEVKRLPESLQDPAIIMRSSTREDALLVVLGYRDADGQAVVAAINPGGTATYDLKQTASNFVLSVYGKARIETLIRYRLADGQIYYISEERCRDLALPELPLLRGGIDPAENIIDNSRADVNHNTAKKTDTGKKAEKRELTPRL